MTENNTTAQATETKTTQTDAAIARDDDRLVWLDMEMTGLNPLSDRIIELAIVITDKNLKTIAEAIDMHESTVSRATANKYVATAHGLFSLRSFFSAGVSAVDGSTMSATRVKREIRDLVAADYPLHPLSDQALTEQLIKKGIAVSRRTVAKYREELEIMPSCRRKK